jgi:hypothetical protein
MDSGRIIKSGTGNDIIPSYIADMNLNIENSFISSKKEHIKVMDKENVKEIKEQLKALDDRDLIKQDEEEKENGKISLNVYKYYCVSIGICLSLLTILSLTFMQGNLFIRFFYYIIMIYK